MGDTQEPSKGQEAPKETRAERSARNKAEHARRQAEAAAKAQAKKNPALDSVLSPTPSTRPNQHAASSASLPPPDHSPDAGNMIDRAEDDAAAPLDSPAQDHARAHTREGEVLAADEFAGLMDDPVPPETAATARYVGQPHEPTDLRHAEVMALRYAGQNDEEIALFLGVSMETLYHHYRVTMAEAHAKMSGRLAIKVATSALGNDFKATRFVAEKRLRGFGRQDQPFLAVRENADGQVDAGLTSRGPLGQSAAALGQRKRVTRPEPDEDGVIEFGMVLGVAERPLKVREDGTVVERNDAEIAADVAEREG